jgi:hypothetical protein
MVTRPFVSLAVYVYQLISVTHDAGGVKTVVRGKGLEVVMSIYLSIVQISDTVEWLPDRKFSKIGRRGSEAYVCLEKQATPLFGHCFVLKLSLPSYNSMSRVLADHP